jgi:hypothetical protein
MRPERDWVDARDPLDPLRPPQRVDRRVQKNPLGFRVDRQVLNSFLQTTKELWLGIISPAARFHGAWSMCSKAMSAGSYWSARARKEGPGRG